MEVGVMHKVKIGVVCLARNTFDHQAALELYNQQRRKLAAVPEVDWVFIDGLTREIDEADRAARQLAGSGLDGLVIISGTFALGHLALILAREVRQPVLLWAFNELPYNGGKIRLNSACAMNFNGSNLYKAGFDYDYHLGDEIDLAWVDALRVRVGLARARVGIVGSYAHGFYTSEPQSLATFHDLGSLVITYPLTDLWNLPVEDREIAEKEAQVRGLFECSAVNDAQVKKVARMAAAIRRFMDERGLTIAAIRCWPEFADNYGIAPCASMSTIQSEGYLTACEGDLEMALSQVALRALGDEAPFSSDLSQVNLAEDFGLMWHCGVAPANLWDHKSVRSLETYHAAGRGVTADFVMKEGVMTMLRFDRAHGRNRVLAMRGRAMGMEKLLKGTYAKVRFERPIREVFDLILRHGFAHHVGMGYGDYLPALEKFAHMQKMELFS
jgi:L-fucose isomerase-like protein